MTVGYRRALASLQALLARHSSAELRARLETRHGIAAPAVPSGSQINDAAIDGRWQALPSEHTARSELLDAQTRAHAQRYAANVENFVGTVKVPVGVIGPMRVNGTYAREDYFVPLATTEATLVASYGRGAKLITSVGGCSVLSVNEGMSRAPGFAFKTLYEAGEFAAWVLDEFSELAEVACGTSRYARLQDVRVNIVGNHVYVIFDFHTGDAAGQNMVTIASQAICEHINDHSPVKPVHYFIEANHCGDKKASAQSFMCGRGRSVSAEIVIPALMVQEHLHTTPEMMAKSFTMAAIGGVMTGTIGVQGHFANGLAAIYLACGQDVASVAESAVGVTRFEMTPDGALYASVTLPCLPVGTVGGGTGLPSQQACLNILGLAGPGHANAFAEVCAALALAGELSIAGALVAGEFSAAHERMARGTGQPRPVPRSTSAHK
jgi:hydroxymethylglutaryl-CoA reductase (NADPH)